MDDEGGGDAIWPVDLVLWGTGVLATTRVQNLWGAAAVVALALVTGPGADAQSTVTGRWEIVLSTQVGDTTWVAAFQQDGDVLSGEIDLGNREIFPL